MHTEVFTYETGQSLFAFPAGGNAANWSTLRVECNALGPGRYTVDLDESIDRTWFIYLGDSAPTDFDDWVGTIEIPHSMTPSGSGARTITITVTDGTDPIASAFVRLSYGVNHHTATTDIDGIATFNVDDGSWIVAATKGGYSFSGTTLSVTADSSFTIEMTATGISPPVIANTCAVVVPAIRSSTPVPGADVTATLPDRFSDLPAGVQMVAVDSAITNPEGIAVLYLPWSSLYIHGDGTYRIRVRDPITQEVVYDRFVEVPNLSTARIDQLSDSSDI